MKKLYLFKSTYWITMNHVLQNGISVVLQIIFARYLSAYSYGVYKYILSLVSSLGSLTPSGLTTALQHDASKGYDGSLVRSFAKSIRWSALTLIAGAVVSVYYFYLKNYLFAGVILLGTLATCINNGALMYNSYLVSKRLFKENFYLFLIINIFSYGLVIPAVLYTQNIFVILATYFTTQLIANFAAYLYTKKYYVQTDTVSEVFDDYAKKMSIASIFSLIAVNLDKVIIFHVLGPVALAVFSFSQIFVDNIRGLLKDYGKIFIGDYSHGDYKVVKARVVSHSIKMFIFSIFVFILYLIISPYLYKFLFPNYLESIFYSNILALSILSSCLTLPINALSQQAKQKALYDFNLYSGVLQITINLIGAYTYGILGVVISNVLHRTWQYFYAMYLMRRDAETIS